MKAPGLPRHVGAAVPFHACRRCGACVAVCPAHAIALDKYRAVVDGCTGCPGLAEGLCLAACPAVADYDVLERRLYGRLRRRDEGFGIWRRALRAITLDPRLRGRAYCGATASALTYAALTTKFVDAAIICAWGDGEPWRPGPRIIRHPEEVALGLGSKYFPSPNVRVLRELGADERVLFVGLPCHVAALRRMAYSSSPTLQRLVSHVKLILGTFCGIPAMLTAEGFAEYIKGRGIPLKRVVRVATECVPVQHLLRSYRVYTATQHVDFPIIQLLRDLGPSRLRCDEGCFDYASELADLSVGGTIPPELPPSYLCNALFVRTALGEELVRIAEKARVLHVQPLGDLGLRGLRLFPPYRRKRARYRRYRRERDASRSSS